MENEQDLPKPLNQCIDDLGLDKDKYDFDRHGQKGKRVGQAAYDILSKEQESQTVGDTIDAFADQYARDMEECIESNRTKYKSPFYILVLTKKVFHIVNSLRNWFIARQTPPHAFQTMEEYSGYTKTLYLVDSHKGNIRLLWSLPGFEDCFAVAKNPQLYSPELVRWIELCFSRKLDRDSYSFDDDLS